MAAAAATPQPLLEAGLALEYEDGGSRLIVRETDPTACRIRNHGGETLSHVLAADRRISALDIRESKIADNGVGHLCLKLRQTDQLEELSLSPIGHVGLEFLLGVVKRCSRLRKLRLEVVDLQTQEDTQKMISPEDYDTSGYVREKKEGEEEDGEDEPEEPAGDEEEDEEVRAQKKLEKLRKIFAENDYDSGDESQAAAAPPRASGGASPALLRLLTELISAVRKKESLVEVECAGDAVPADLRLDLQRAVEEHRELHETRERRKQERGARTAFDALKDQMEELRGAAEGGAGAGAERLPGEPDAPPDASTRLGIRSYVGRRLFSALGEALFECQRFKSKENEAVTTSQGEMAFIAMYLRRHMQEHSKRGRPE